MFNSDNGKYQSITNVLIVKKAIDVKLCILLGCLCSQEAYESFWEII